MHVLSLCICNRRVYGGNESYIILAPQRNKFVFQFVPIGTLMKVPMFMRLLKQSQHIQEETSPLVSQTHWTGLTNKKNVMGCFYLSFFPFIFKLLVCLSLPLSLWVHSCDITSWAKLESSCQWKQYFLWEYCSYYVHANDALYIFNLVMLFHIVTPESFYLALRCIFHLSTQSLVMIFWNNHVYLPWCKLQIPEKDEYFLICSNEGERVVALLTDVIKRNCVVAEGFLMMFRSTWSVYF